MILSINQTEAKQLLEDLIFRGDRADEWVQDVWSLSSTLGESAASLVDVFNLVLSILNDTQREELLQKIYCDHPEVLDDADLLDRWQEMLKS